MSLSELQVLTDIANRGDFYNERDEFNTIMKLNEEVDSSIEDLYALYDIVDSGKDLASLEGFVGQDLKKLTGKSEVSMEGLSMLVVVGIVALLGAIIALLIWVIRSFSKTGSAVANTANNVNKLIDEAKKGVSKLKPPQPVVDAIDEVMKDLRKHIEESHNLQDEEEKRLQNLANKADETTKLVEEMVSEAKSDEVPIEIDSADCPHVTPEEESDEVGDWLKRAAQLREEAKRNLTEEAHAVLNNNESEYKNTLKDTVLESEKELHALFKDLKQNIGDELPLYGEDYIVDPAAVSQALAKLDAALPHISANLKSVSQIVDGVSNSVNDTIRMSKDIFDEILRFSQKKQEDEHNLTLSEYATIIEQAIKTDELNTTRQIPHWAEQYIKRFLSGIGRHKNNIMTLLGTSSKTYMEAFDKAFQVPSQCVADVNTILSDAKRLYLKDYYTQLTNNALDLLKKEIPSLMRQYYTPDLLEKTPPLFYQDIYSKLLSFISYTYPSGADHYLDVSSIADLAEVLRSDIEKLSKKFNDHVERYNDGYSDDLAERYKKIIIPLMRPYLDIVAQCKSIVSASIDAVTLIKRLDTSIRGGYNSAFIALRNALSKANTQTNETLTKLVLTIASQLTKWYVAPPTDE